VIKLDDDEIAEDEMEDIIFNCCDSTDNDDRVEYLHKFPRA